MSYTLSAVDELDGKKGATIDTLPIAASTGVLRIRGGDYDGAGNISKVVTKFVVYSKNGGVYKLPMQTDGFAPVPTRLSTEANLVALPAGAVIAQTFSGDEALLRYDSSVLGQTRYIRLSMTPTSAPLNLGPSPFIGGGSQQVVAGINDIASGAIVFYLLTDGARMYRTDSSFQNPFILQPYSAGAFQVPGAPSVARMGKGFFFVSDGVLRRYDYAERDVRSVFGLTTTAANALADDTHFYVLYDGPAGFTIVKSPDTLDSRGVILASNIAPASITGAAPRFAQTKDHLIFLNASGQAVAVRKSDGAQTNLGGIAGDWDTISTQGLDGPIGNRVFYSKTDAASGKRVFGSVNADGTDRKEIIGAVFAGVRGLPGTLGVHRSQIGDARGPFSRLLVAVGDITNAADLKGDLSWVSATTGTVEFVAGSLGSATLGVEPSGPFNPGWIGQAGTVTFANKSVAGLGLVRNAYFLKQSAASLVLIP